MIDPQRLAEIALGCGVTEGSLLEEFRRINAQDSASLKAALAAADLAGASLLAHRIGGAAQTLGAHPLAQACDALRAACEGGTGAHVDRALAAVAAELARFEAGPA